jgi:hypothetical protein
MNLYPDTDSIREQMFPRQEDEEKSDGANFFGDRRISIKDVFMYGKGFSPMAWRR